LRSAIESEDALKEEFQSANEEILSANEELQSTNEELETSKEELQSTNEELNTLNVELRSKNDELHELSNDVINFLNSTRIPVVMLDQGLRIRRLTPTADRLLKIRPSDVGRPLADIRPNIEAPELEQLVAKVLETLQSEEREVRDLRGHWHSLNILPYRTQENKIDGVVLALQDIDALKAAAEQSRKAAEFFQGVLGTVRGPLLVLDRELRVFSANDAFLSTFQVSPEETIHRFLYDLGNGQWNIPWLRELLQRVLSQGQAVTDFEIEHDFESIGGKTMVLNANIVTPNAGDPMLLLAIDDITERKQTEAALMKSEKLAAAGRLAAVLAHEINNPLQAVTNVMALLAQSSNMDSRDQQFVKTAIDELARVNRLTQQSLRFYRESVSPTSVNVEEEIESVLDLYAKRITAKNITVTKQYKADGALIHSYPGEVRQVFSTLLINAMEAVPLGGRFALRVSQSADRSKAKAVDGVRITLADSGCGILPHHAARVFEPFFTTKGESGTGLGLWVARAITSRLGGSIRMRSRVHPDNGGTCFSVFLPKRPPPRLFRKQARGGRMKPQRCPNCQNASSFLIVDKSPMRSSSECGRVTRPEVNS
jgi:two-component system CheB/CheR fusion protein